MEVTDIIWLSIAAALAAYLVFRYWQRQTQRPPESHWTGHGIDVTAVTDRVQRVRNDFTTAAHSRAHEVCYRRGLLASAKKAIGQLPYFRRQGAKSSSQTDDETESHAA